VTPTFSPKSVISLILYIKLKSYVTDIWGTGTVSSPVYVWNGSAYHYEAASDMSGLIGYDPMITSGARGKVMVTWNWLFTSTSDYDVWARMIRVFWTDFLPIMAK